jgi:hypothetical protein
MSGITVDPNDNVSGLPIPVSRDSLRAYLRLALYLVFGAAMLCPLLWATVPPLVDYPNHLARMWILVHHAAIPELARNYIVSWRLLPDMAMDLVVPALAQVVSVIDAGRVFIGMTMVGLVAGTVTLHRVLHGRFAIWPLWSVLFVYNAVLFWGFLGCLFASAIYLFAFSGWIASRNWRLLSRILVFSAVAAALFLLHAFAFGLYGLSVASYELGRRFEGRKLPLRSLVCYTLVCLQFIPGLFLWYLSLGNVQSAYTAYGGLTSKLYAVASPVTFGVQPAMLDKITWLAVAITLMFSVTRRALRIVLEMRLPLAAMVVVAILMPNFVNGSWGADFRLPVILPFVLLASTQLEATSKPLLRGLSLAMIVLFGLRIVAVSRSWHDYDRWFDEFRRASAVISPGSRLLIVETPLIDKRPQLSGVPIFSASLQPQIFHHMGALAVIDRSAFFPYLFTGPTTVHMTPVNQTVSQTVSDPITPDELVRSANPATAKSTYSEPDIYGQLPHWRDWPRTFDYVLWMDFGEIPKPELQELRLVERGSLFTLYKVVKR